MPELAFCPDSLQLAATHCDIFHPIPPLVPICHPLSLRLMPPARGCLPYLNPPHVPAHSLIFFAAFKGRPCSAHGVLFAVVAIAIVSGCAAKRELTPLPFCESIILTRIFCCSYSGMGAYSLAPSLATAPPNLPVLSGNFSFGWSGLYSSALALPSGETQIQLQVTLGDTQGRGTQVFSHPLQNTTR